MGDSKLEIKVGSISFSGEGSGDWLSKQLDKVLAKIPELVAVVPLDDIDHASDGGGKPNRGVGARTGNASGTLAAFLKAKSATGNQNRKFLATAVWLHDTEQKNRLTTADVTGALSQHNQGKIANAALCLTRNIGKGFCVREGKQFYVSDEGRESLR